MISPNPRDLGVPHDTWRKSQDVSVEWAKEGGTRVLEAVCGSGKSSVAKALSHFYKTVVLTHTKQLQLQYGPQPTGIYDAAVLFGKNNTCYPCIHPEANRNALAGDCLYQNNGGMRKCPFAENCVYLIDKNRALYPDNNFTALNYALWLADYARWPDIGALVMDECHLIPRSVILEHCGTTITETQLAEWDGLPDFPEADSSARSILGQSPSAVEPVADWLGQCIGKLEAEYDKLTKRNNLLNERTMYRARDCDRLIKKLAAVLGALSASDESSWYIRSGPEAVDYYNRTTKNVTRGPGLICRPLSPRQHFKRYFMHKERPLSLLMSATVGDDKLFARVLGLDDYQFRNVPSQWPPEARQIHILKDAPKMHWKSTDADYMKQAEVIYKAITNKDLCDPSWSGIIHVTRVSEVMLLGRRLQQLGLGERIYIPPEDVRKTEEIVALWEKRKRKIKNSVIVSCSLGHGFDGVDESINIVAKVAYPTRGAVGSYEHELMNYNMDLYTLSAVQDTTQRLGRVYRGRPQDYNTDGHKRKFVAVADMAIEKLKDKFASDIRDSMIFY